MTDTTSPGAPGAPDIFSAGADQMIDLFTRKGLLWKMILGTASSSAPNGVFYNVLAVPATLDGDSTTVSARSLIGPVNEGARVAMIYVPPTGYYIVGYVANPGHGFALAENRITSVSFTSLSSTTVNVTFTHPFSTAPVITTNINSGAGATAQWHSRAINITATGFQLFLFGAGASTWSNVAVQWMAGEPTP
jgi:hypothetical protein